MKKSTSLILKSDTQLSLKKAGRLIGITDKILFGTELPVDDEPSWSTHFSGWADENNYEIEFDKKTYEKAK